MRKAKMTRAHFYLVADAISTSGLGRTAKAKLAVHFAGKLMRTNPAFNYWRFVEAATGEDRHKLPKSITLLR